MRKPAPTTTIDRPADQAIAVNSDNTPVQVGATTAIAPAAAPALTISEKFVEKIEKQFKAEMGAAIHWTTLQRTLAQHLYVKIDMALKAAEIKRQGNSYAKDDPAITWANVNMPKLALDSVQRISMDLDAALKNFIHPIAYLNRRTGLYDIDLRIGYMGVDYVTRRFALTPVLDIKYKLVHDSDTFSVTNESGIESPDFKQTSPFNPGEVIGGFGYVTYEDPRLNYVQIVEYREFEKAQNASKGTEFWGGPQTKWENGQRVSAGHDDKFKKEMQFKTVVFRICDKIRLDPAKINVAALQALSDARLDYIEAEFEAEVDQNANQTPLALAEANPVADQETGEVIETAAPVVAASDATADGQPNLVEEDY